MIKDNQIHLQRVVGVKKYKKYLDKNRKYIPIKYVINNLSQISGDEFLTKAWNKMPDFKGYYTLIGKGK